MESSDVMKTFRQRTSREGKNLDGTDSGFCTVLGMQWGDEGKGKLVDILAKNYDICARFNGGSNAGHTVKVDGVKYAFSNILMYK